MKLGKRLCSHYLNLDFSEHFLRDDEKHLCVQLPYPIGKPLKNTEIDIIDQFSKDLETYSKQFSTLERDFQVVKHKILTQTFDNSHAAITQGILNYCNSKKSESPFLCDYNPYYATGFLEYFCIYNSNYIIRPDCKNRLCVTNLANPWKHKQISLKYFTDEQVIGISSYSNNEMLLLRHKSSINLVEVNDNMEIAIKWTKKFKRSLLNSKLNKTKLGVVLSNTKFRLYDIETDKKINSLNYSDPVTYFEFVDNSIAFLNQKSIKIIDQRSNECSRLLKPELDNCNYLCSVKICDNLMYVNTRHHLLRTDIRFLKNVEFCTHLMKYSPCYMEYMDHYLCLSSQKATQKVLFSGNPISSLPHHVPSISESLTKCRLQKDVLLREGFSERLQKSVGGIKLIRDNNDVYLYSVNSLGDLFRQKITDDVETNEDDAVNALYKWVNKIPQPPKTLHLTNMANLSDARFILNKVMKKQDFTKYTSESPNLKRFIHHFDTIYNRNNVGTTASNFMLIWDQDEEEEREDVQVVPEVAPLEKVTSWMESSYFCD
jgi:hypothetical protein